MRDKTCFTVYYTLFQLLEEKLAEYEELRETNSEVEGMLGTALIHVLNPLEVLNLFQNIEVGLI